MARPILKDAPDEVNCAYCGKAKKAEKHTQYKYRKGQRVFYCDDRCRVLASKTICIIENCGREAIGKKYCGKHYKRIWRHGKITQKTRFDPNVIVVENGVCRIYIYDKNGEKQAEAIIDIEDAERCQTKRWSLRNDYVCSGENTYLHNFILGRKTNMKEMTDHRDRNKLNNRKGNLRECNKSQNAANAIKQRGETTSIYKGVYWKKSRSRWVAKITKDYKGIYLGSFISEIGAAMAYNDAAKMYFGEFSLINKI